MVKPAAGRALILVRPLGLALALVGSLAMFANARDQSVSIIEFEFSASSVTVTAGDVVTWTNDGDRAHTVTADDASFDSAELSPGDPFATVFTTPGTYAYHCSIHAQMQGQVVVEAASATASGSEEPTPPPGNVSPSLPTQATGSPAPSPTPVPSADPSPPANDPGVFQWILLGLIFAIALVLVLTVTTRRR